MMNTAPILRTEPSRADTGKVPMMDDAGTWGTSLEWSKNVTEWPTVSKPFADKLNSFFDARRDCHAVLLRVSDEERAAGEALREAERRYEKLTNAPDRLPDAHPLVYPVKEKIRLLKANLERLSARYRELEPRFHSAGRLWDNLEKYVRKVARERPLSICDDPAPQLLGGETDIAAFERAARRTRTLQSDRERVQAAPLPVSFAQKLARSQFEERINAARPDVACLIEQGLPIEFPTTRTSLSQKGTAGAVNIIDPVGLIGWLFRREFLAAIDKEIAAAGDDENALSVEQRLAKLAEIDADILASEREEAYFAQRAGLLLRPDIDPRAALNLSADMPPRSFVFAVRE